MSESNGRPADAPVLRESPLWPRVVIEDIQTKAQLGRYRMQGFSMHRVVPNLDDLTFVPCTLSRVPLEGYREKCETRTVLGTRFAANPVVLDRPITIAGMSYGALSGRAKTALGTAAKRAGISTTTGDGGMCREEREAVDTMVYQVLPSRYGFNPDHMKMAQAIEIVVGQGAKPGTGGVLLGSKVSEEIAEQRTLPVGVDQRSPVRHPDFIGPDDLQLKIEEIREATDWQVPIYVKMGASRVSDDVKLAVKAGADVLVIDGMEGATGASPDALLDHTGVPTLSALCEAVRSLEEMKALGEVQVIISGGIKNGVDAAKALALGADAVSIGTAALIALNCNAPLFLEDYEKLGVKPGYLPPLSHGPLPGRDHHAGSGADAAAGDRCGGRPRLQLPAVDDHGDADARPRVRQERRPRPGGRGHACAHAGVLADHGDPPRRDGLRAHARGDRRPGGVPPVRRSSPRARVTFLIDCPNCGPREALEFGFGGETTSRAGPDADDRELAGYLYFRRNVNGWQTEWWLHRDGCRRWFLAERHTSTNEIRRTFWPTEREESPA